MVSDLSCPSVADSDMEEAPSAVSGMLDRSRIGFCIFMFAVLAFNPFSSLLDQSAGDLPAAAAHGPARTLLSMPGQSAARCTSLVRTAHCCLELARYHHFFDTVRYQNTVRYSILDATDYISEKIIKVTV